MRRMIVYMSACTDGSGFFTRGNQSWGPYSAVIFNLPPRLRNKFGCMLLFGVMPIKIKNYNSTYAHTSHMFLRVLLPRMQIHRAGGGYPPWLQGVPVGRSGEGTRIVGVQCTHSRVDAHLDNHNPSDRGQRWPPQASMLSQTTSVHRQAHPNTVLHGTSFVVIQK